MIPPRPLTWYDIIRMFAKQPLGGYMKIRAIVLAACLAAAPLFAGTDPPADICTGAYFYQRACDTTWFAAWPGSGQPVGHTYQGCSAHTWIIHAEDGKDYPIINQHPAVGGYRRAPADAPTAQAEWDKCFLPPHVGLPASYRCATTVPPIGTLVYAMKTLAQMPDPPRTSFAALYGCSGTPTPSATLPAPPTPTPTAGPPPPNQFARHIEALARAGVTAGCGGGKFCPDRTMTRAEVAAWLVNAMGYPLLPCEQPQRFLDVPCN